MQQCKATSVGSLSLSEVGIDLLSHHMPSIVLFLHPMYYFYLMRSEFFCFLFFLFNYFFNIISDQCMLFVSRHIYSLLYNEDPNPFSYQHLLHRISVDYLCLFVLFICCLCLSSSTYFHIPTLLQYTSVIIEGTKL